MRPLLTRVFLDDGLEAAVAVDELRFRVELACQMEHGARPPPRLPGSHLSVERLEVRSGN